MLDFEEELKLRATQMLVHAFERSLGERLREINQVPSTTVISRCAQSDRAPAESSASLMEMIEEAYLFELLDWFVEVCPEDEKATAKDLRQWLSSNAFSDIRNRTSHTNRGVTEHPLLGVGGFLLCRGTRP